MKNRCLLLCLLLSAVLYPCPARSDTGGSRLNRAAGIERERIESARQALDAERDRIAAEREPLAARIHTLRMETDALRRSAAQLQRARTLRTDESDRLRRSAETARQTRQNLLFSMRDYLRTVDTHRGAAEATHLRDVMQFLNNDLARAAEGDLQTSISNLLAHAETWTLQKQGGVLFSNTCLSAEGRLTQGTFAVIGPATFFTAADGHAAGYAVTDSESAYPRLVEAAGETRTAIETLCGGNRATVPVDLSGGLTLLQASRNRTAAEHLSAGGLVMIPLVIIGILAICLTLLKLVSLYRIRIPSESKLDELGKSIRARNLADAENHAQAMSDPFRTVLSAGVEYHGARETHLEEILQERALAMIPSLERHLGMLAVLGGVAPLLGLLGTVTGMIHTFELVTIFGSGDARLLSGGIAEALITTETGLVIAVPVLLAHAFLSRRVRTIVAALEHSVVGLVNRIHREGANGDA